MSTDPRKLGGSISGPDGLAALASQAAGLAVREGGDFAAEFSESLNRRLEELP